MLFYFHKQISVRFGVDLPLEYLGRPRDSELRDLPAQHFLGAMHLLLNLLIDVFPILCTVLDGEEMWYVLE